MKRRPRERSLSREDVSVKRIVRHKSHHELDASDMLNRDSRNKHSERSVHHSNYSQSGSSGGGASFHKYGGSNNSSNGKYHSHHRNDSGGSSHVDSRSASSSDKHRHSHYNADTSHTTRTPTQMPHVNLDQIDFSLHVSNLAMHPSDEEIRRELFNEFKEFGYISVKVVGFGKDRRAFVNYNNYGEARRAKHETQSRVVFSRPLRVEWSRSTIIKYPYVASRKSPSGGSPTGSSTPSHHYDYSSNSVGNSSSRERVHERIGSHSSEHSKRDVSYRTNSSATTTTSSSRSVGASKPKSVVPVVDPSATRTLFVGNLESDITERELRDLFGAYGRIESVDIKHQRASGSAYAFVKYTTITDAMNAKEDMHGRQYGQFRLKIGFGRGSPTGKVWVGNLTQSRDLAELRHEFDRFGLIRRCDYRDGENHAFIHFESLDAAQAAVSALKNFRLRNGRVLRIDLHKPLHLREGEELGPGYHSGNGAETPPTRRSERHDSDDFVSTRHHEKETENDFSSSSNRSSYYNRTNSTSDRVVSNSDDRTSRKRSHSSPSRHYDSSHNSSSTYRQVSHENSYNGDSGSQPKRRAVEYESRSRDRLDHNRHHSSSRSDHYSSNERNRRDHSGEPRRREPVDEKEKEKAKTPDKIPENGQDSASDTNPVPPTDTALQTLATETAASSLMETDTALKLTSSTEPISPASEGKLTKQDSTPLSLVEMAKLYPIAWRGNMVLKNTGFPTRMHLVGGDPSVAEYLLRAKDDQSALRITQRLRLEQPRLDEVNKRISLAGPSGYCTLLALPGPTSLSQNSPDHSSDGNTQLRPLRSLVTYLKQKEAAGIVALSGADIGETGENKDVIGVLHAFPPCEFSQNQLLKNTTITNEPTKEDHIVVLLVKGNV